MCLILITSRLNIGKIILFFLRIIPSSCYNNPMIRQIITSIATIFIIDTHFNGSSGIQMLIDYIKCYFCFSGRSDSPIDFLLYKISMR